MLKTALYNVKGEKKGEATLPESVFGVPSNDTLLHQVYVAIAGNRRATIAHTKDRGERSGSGKKPWKQKGTGRARIGSIRAPHWRKGGVVFGPSKEQNFSKRVNRGMRRKAVVVALSEKFRAGKLRVIDTLLFETRKTKEFASMLNGMGTDGKRSLIAFAPEERGEMILSRNIPKTENVMTENISVYDLLNAEFLVLSKRSVNLLGERFAISAEAEKKAEKK